MKYTILYIDDEATNLRVFKSVFRREFNILTALSGKEGLDILDKENCDLIICDQRMPIMTGVEFLEKVFYKIPKKPPNRIILSGFSENKDIKRAKEKFFMDKFISKPWDAVRLKKIMYESILKNLDDDSGQSEKE